MSEPTSPSHEQTLEVIRCLKASVLMLKLYADVVSADETKAPSLRRAARDDGSYAETVIAVAESTFPDLLPPHG